MRHRNDAIIDSPSDDAIQARSSGLPREPRHRGLRVGEIVTYYKSPNTEVTVKIKSCNQVTFLAVQEDEDVTAFPSYIGPVSRTVPTRHGMRLTIVDESEVPC